MKEYTLLSSARQSQNYINSFRNRIDDSKQLFPISVLYQTTTPWRLTFIQLARPQLVDASLFDFPGAGTAEREILQRR